MDKFSTGTGIEYVLMGDKVVVKGAMKGGNRVLRFKDTVEAKGYYNVEKWVWGISKNLEGHNGT